MITKLGNALLNLQQISSQQATHIVLSLPLNHSSRKCIFIDTRDDYNHTFILIHNKELLKEPDESKNVLSKSLMDYYLSQLPIFHNICLAKFIFEYNKKGTKYTEKTKSSII